MSSLVKYDSIRDSIYTSMKIIKLFQERNSGGVSIKDEKLLNISSIKCNDSHYKHSKSFNDHSHLLHSKSTINDKCNQILKEINNNNSHNTRIENRAKGFRRYDRDYSPLQKLKVEMITSNNPDPDRK